MSKAQSTSHKGAIAQCMGLPMSPVFYNREQLRGAILALRQGKHDATNPDSSTLLRKAAIDYVRIATMRLRTELKAGARHRYMAIEGSRIY